MTGLTERWLIDRDGRHWCWNDARLAEALGTTLSGAALTEFALANLGFVDLRYTGTTLHVRCRPRLVHPLTFGSLCYFLGAFQWRTIGLSLLSHSWSARVLPDIDQVIALLTTYIHGRDRSDDDRLGRFLRGARPGSASPLRNPMREAIEVINYLDVNEASLTALDQIFRSRWSISHVDLETNEFAMDFMGTGFTPLDPAWTGARLFRPVAQFADRAYMGWIEGTRRSVARGAEPIFEDVDAWTDTPDGMARLRYHRVTVPLRRSGSRRYVLSASVSDCAIDLRKAA